MKWKVENVGPHCNILQEDNEPIGLGFPKYPLAERIVNMHNEALDKLQEEIDDLQGKSYCYENAYKYLLRNNKKAILCHGIVTGFGEIEGIEYGHAWIEYDGMSRDCTLNKEIPSIIYRKVGRARNVIEYTLEEANEMVLKSGIFGPWDKTISEAAHRED